MDDLRRRTGRAIREKRKAAPAPLNTQEGLSEAIGFTQPAISAWEGGKSFPSPAALAALHRTLGLDLSEVLADEGAPA